jgi:hypothetical protein
MIGGAIFKFTVLPLRTLQRSSSPTYWLALTRDQCLSLAAAGCSAVLSLSTRE